MKKIFSLIVFTAIVFTVTAQTTVPPKKTQEKNMRTDVRNLKEERKERNKKIEKGHLKSAHRKQVQINKDRKDMNANKKQLKNKGVKHPVEKAKEQTGTRK
jgi:hypothetical protein